MLIIVCNCLRDLFCFFAERFALFLSAIAFRSLQILCVDVGCALCMGGRLVVSVLGRAYFLVWFVLGALVRSVSLNASEP